MKIDGKAIFARIKSELEATGKEREWFCVQVGVPIDDYSQHWTHWVNRGFPKSRLFAAAETLGLASDWLAKEEGPKYKDDYDGLAAIRTRQHDKYVMGPMGNIESHPESLKSVAGALPLNKDFPPLLTPEQARKRRDDVDLKKNGSTRRMIDDLELTDAAFKYVARGMGMSPKIEDGDKIIIDPGIAAQDSDTVLVEIAGDQSIMQLWRINGEDWLTFSNPAYGDMKKPLSTATVLGVVMGKIQPLIKISLR